MTSAVLSVLQKDVPRQDLARGEIPRVIFSRLRKALSRCGGGELQFGDPKMHAE
jgi:hypothetical protein